MYYSKYMQVVKRDVIAILRMKDAPNLEYYSMVIDSPLFSYIIE